MSQLAANILLLSARYVLTAFGFSLVYRTSGCVDFAQGAMYLGGAYLSYALAVLCGLPIFYAIVFAVIAMTLLAGAVDFLLYRQMRLHGRSVLPVMLASLGILVVFQNVASLAFGDVTVQLRHNEVEPGLPVLGARLTPNHLLIICAAGAVITVCWLIWHHTRWGTAARAVASSNELAIVTGLGSEARTFQVAMIAGAISGMAGALVSLDIAIEPAVGMEAIMVGILVVLLSGKGTIGATGLAAVIAAGVQDLSGALISHLWREPIAFALILLVFLIRPCGLFTKKVEHL